ncbi:MAG TPA: hydrogenase maturation protease, partial [Casimicrobiaceae bacterium]|nr:hydrogenase maturation protease [Casimicrobiaceae bacterium]
MVDRCEALVLGIGNVLWADEGFGVRAVEAWHAKYASPDGVSVLDGGTQGLYLYGAIAAARRVLLFDAID